MVQRTEHLRTPLQTILDLEAQLRGSIAGFLMPQFVVDLPGGGGKRLACSFKTYDRETGRSTYEAPVLAGEGKVGRVYEYWDPIVSLPAEGSLNKGIENGLELQERVG
jgi:lysine 2,3-aminomutase